MTDQPTAPVRCPHVTPGQAPCSVCVQLHKTLNALCAHDVRIVELVSDRAALRAEVARLVGELNSANERIQVYITSIRARGQQIDRLRADLLAAGERADETRRLIVKMRKYVVYHGVLIGECVAWNKLKEMYAIGDEGMT